MPCAKLGYMAFGNNDWRHIFSHSTASQANLSNILIMDVCRIGKKISYIIQVECRLKYISFPYYILLVSLIFHIRCLSFWKLEMLHFYNGLYRYYFVSHIWLISILSLLHIHAHVTSCRDMLDICHCWTFYAKFLSSIYYFHSLHITSLSRIIIEYYIYWHMMLHTYTKTQATISKYALRYL